jgi:hypothetical protein
MNLRIFGLTNNINTTDITFEKLIAIKKQWDAIFDEKEYNDAQTGDLWKPFINNDGEHCYFNYSLIERKLAESQLKLDIFGWVGYETKEL